MGNDDLGGTDRPRENRRRRRPLRTLVVGISVLALLGVVSLVGFAFYLQRTVENNIVHEDLRADDNSEITLSPDQYGANQPRDPEAEADGGGNADADAEAGDADAGDEEEGLPLIVGEDGEEISVEGGSIVSATNPARPESAGEALNILIIGTASRDLSVERGRSDVIILAHVDNDRSRVDLVHFPRDLFVPIAGTGGSSKINAAYAYGGAPLLVQTLQPLINVPIDHVAITNFDNFKAMTDAIGGVQVQVTEAGGGFSTGTHHMNGEQGLRFVRERYSLSQGDISRGERQMQFVKGVMNKALSRETLTNPARLARFVDAASTTLTVDADLRVSDMRDLGFAMRDVRGGDIHFWTAPWNGIDMHPVAGSIVVMASEQMQSLSQHLQNDSMDSYVDTVSPRQGFGG